MTASSCFEEIMRNTDEVMEPARYQMYQGLALLARDVEELLRLMKGTQPDLHVVTGSGGDSRPV